MIPTDELSKIAPFADETQAHALLPFRSWKPIVLCKSSDPCLRNIPEWQDHLAEYQRPSFRAEDLTHPIELSLIDPTKIVALVFCQIFRSA